MNDIHLSARAVSRAHMAHVCARLSPSFERIRDRHDRQCMALPARLGIHHPKLVQVITRMEESLKEPISRAKLAAAVGLSNRQIERLFLRYLRRSPARYYMELRLDRARRLLHQTDLSVTHFGLACGFVSASHFAKTYRESFDKTPRQERLGVLLSTTVET